MSNKMQSRNDTTIKKLEVFMKITFLKTFIMILLLVSIGLACFLPVFAAEVWISKAGFSAQSMHELGTDNTGSVVVEFDATPLEEFQDGVICYYDSSVEMEKYGDAAVLVRFNNTGTIDARCGKTYTNMTDIIYTANKKYHFKLTVNIPESKFSASVDGVVIAKDYDFRTGALPMDDLGRLTIVSFDNENMLKVENHKVYLATTANPKTGDSSMLFYVFAIMMVTAVIVGGTIIKIRRNA